MVCDKLCTFAIVRLRETMHSRIHFTKMDGAGNDYIYVDTTRYPISDPQTASVKWSNRHTGIGSDGLVLIGKPSILSGADFSMRIFNADGSEAKMCGNASRCIGKYLYEYGLTSKNVITLDTLSGIKILELHLEGRTVETVTVDMGVPLGTGTIDFDGEFPFLSTQVSMGNPHLVTFVDDIRTVNLSEMGPKLEKHSLFPDRTNVEFAQITGENTIRMRVWERGSGITQACGTGACATAVAAHLTGRTGRTVNVVMDGGTLTIEWDEATGHISMTGPAVKVFDGTIELRE